MKRQMSATSVLLSALFLIATGTAALAQQSPTVVVKVPFDFVVGTQTLPAGEYTINRASKDRPDFILLRGSEGKAAIIQTGSVARKVPAGRAELKFTHYEDQYSLSQIWMPGEKEGRLVNKSRRQKSLELELASRAESGPSNSKLVEESTVKVVGSTR